MRPLAAIEKMRAGFAMVGPDERLSYVNQAFADMLGYAPKSMVGLHPLEFVTKNAEIVREQLEATRLARPIPYELHGMVGGRRLSVLVMPTAMHDSGGSYLGGFSVNEVIGPRKTLHDQELDLARTAGGIAAQAEIISSAQRRQNLDLSVLSAREVEIARFLLSGKKSTAIAGAYHISVHTVRQHLKSIYRKLGVHSQLELTTKFR